MIGIVVGLIAGSKMMVEHGGCCSRWGNFSSTLHVDEFQRLSCVGPISNINCGWENVEPCDTENLFGALDDNETFDASCNVLDGLSVEETHVPQFSRPKPKICACKPFVLSEVSVAIKCTADESASRYVHKMATDLKQLWQTGPLASSFGRPKPFWDRLHVAQKLPLVGLSDHITAGPSSSAVPMQIQQTELTVQRIRSSSLVTSSDNFHHVALAWFKTMVPLDFSCTRLGRSLVSFAGTLCSNDELSKVFIDVFFPRVTSTIMNRCSALWRFSCLIQTRLGGSPFNQSYATMYSHVCHLRDSGARATPPSQFVEALRFADALIGVTTMPLQDMLIPRVTGAAHSFDMTKRIRKPAEVLTVRQTSTLEEICMHDPEVYQRLIAGHLIFSFMDLPPFTALGRVTCEESCGSSWMQSRKDSNAGMWNYFLDLWSESSQDWVDSRMSKAEVTLLSWAAKSTPFTADEQLALGHHFCAQCESAMMYSRDNQISLCEKIHCVFSYMRDGTFDLGGTGVRRCFQLAFETALERESLESDDSYSDRVMLHQSFPQQAIMAPWDKRAVTDGWKLTT